MRIEVLADEHAVAEAAAALIAQRARAAVALRGRFVLALSGGRTPWLMLAALARMELPWADLRVVQVDERVAPAGAAERNLTRIRESLGSRLPLFAGNVHPMPVEASDLDAAVLAYASTLRAVAGTPVILDLVHLGLGADGHTASLVPADAALDVEDADVTLAGPYQGTRRMTLTLPVIRRAREVMFVITGADKSAMLARLRAHDPLIPAGRVENARTVVLADTAAVSG